MRIVQTTGHCRVGCPRRLPAVSGALALFLLTAAVLLAPPAPAAPLGRAPAYAREAVAPRLRIQPGTVPRGGRLTLIGSNFRRNETVRLYIGPPQSEASYFGSARTGPKGGFRKDFRVHPSATPGRYVVIACQRNCRIKASATVRIVAAGGVGRRTNATT